MAGVRFPAGLRYFTLFHSVHTGSGAYTDSSPMGNSGFFLGGKTGKA
jgi:hypothetical protein